MRCLLEIDLDATAHDPGTELSRALRYWAGSIKYLDLTQEAEHDITDSDYAKIGTLRLIG